MELDLHGGGIDARGAAFPGISFYVLLGRGKDYAWSLTSSTLGPIDDYARSSAATTRTTATRARAARWGASTPARSRARRASPTVDSLFRTTVHGPVIGYATVGGGASRSRASARRAAASCSRRSPSQDLNTNKPRNAAEFLRSAARLEMTFNWVYADDRDIAMFSSGRLPIRPDTVDPGLPTLGTGDYEWRGFAPVRAATRRRSTRERRDR